MFKTALYCTIDKISIDSDAEATITLKIPASNLEEVTELMKHTEQLLEFIVKESDKKVYEL